MKLIFRLEFMIDTNKLTSFFDKNNVSANKAIQPKLTVEKLTDTYKER